jgi:hypothetical protein
MMQYMDDEIFFLIRIIICVVVQCLRYFLYTMLQVKARCFKGNSLSLIDVVQGSNTGLDTHCSDWGFGLYSRSLSLSPGKLNTVENDWRRQTRPLVREGAP